MKHYDSYKDSGIEWISEIPSHWDVKKHKHSISILSGYPFDSDKFNSENGKPLIRIRDITSGYIETYYDGSYDDKYVIRKGDLLIGMDGDFNLRWWDNEEGLLNQRCCKIIEPFHVSKRYLYYILPSELKVINDLTYFTTVKHLSNSDILDNKTLLPPLSEQEHIVSYLDDKTTKIDELIQKKLRKIDLLKEYRTSLINTVVTKGLNPNVPMKDSGIEWIGEIPSHWEKSRLDFLFRLYGRVGWKSLKSDEYVEDGYVFLSTPNIKDKVINYVDVNYITKERYDESPEIMLENGDVLLVKDGSTLGIVNIVVDLPRPSTVNSSIGVLKKISDKISPMFMYYHLTSDYHQNIINRIKGGMGVPHLFQSDIKKFYVILPPISEQEHIVSYLDEKTSQIDKTIDIEKKKIEHLKEYRQSLISNVVTGKIKVIE
jgi:type I restriction enzyme S subunit